VRARLVLIAAGLVGLGLLADGCGDSKGPAVAALGTTTSSNTPPATRSGGGSDNSGPGQSGGGGSLAIAGGTRNRNSLMKFAACMRSHGVPNFPDPNAQGVISVTPSSGIKDSSRFTAAQQACRKNLPNGGTPTPAQQAEARAQALAFSACMRRNGLPNFPDPQFGPGGKVEIQVGSSSGLNKDSPQFQHAITACQKDIPGRVTVGKQPAGRNSSGGQ
jgi:hypothetical protein